MKKERHRTSVRNPATSDTAVTQALPRSRDVPGALSQDAFVELLSRISAQLIEMPPQRVDREIPRVLREVVEEFHLDRSTVWEITKDRKGFHVTHSWAVIGVAEFPKLDIRHVLPYLSEQALEGVSMRYDTLDMMPEAASLDRLTLQQYGQKSMLVFPFRVGGSYVGAVSFGVVRRECRWSDELTTRLRLVSMAIATTLARKQADEAMQWSEARLGEVQRIANLGTWENPLPVGTWTGSRQLYRLFDVDQRAEIDLDALLSHIHPGDRKRFQSRLEAYESGAGEEFGTFRVVRGKGDVHHVQFWAELQRDSDGKPYRLLGVAQDVTLRKRSEEALRSLSSRLLRAQEEERARIARELHDDLSQRMALINMKVDILAQMSKDPRTEDELSQLSADVGELATSMRKLSHGLHPSALQHLGLVAALDKLRREIARLHGLDIEFEHQGVPQRLQDEAALGLYRIAQEALRNVVKHSGSETATVRLQRMGDCLELAIADQGHGFDTEASKGESGLGLLGMRERLRLVDGQLTIESRPGHGTRVKAVIPVTRNVRPPSVDPSASYNVQDRAGRADRGESR